MYKGNVNQFLNSKKRQELVDRLDMLDMWRIYSTESNHSNLTKYNGNQDIIKLPDLFTRINEKAFEKNIKVKEIEMNEHLTSIGSSAFSNCIKLNKVKLNSAIQLIGFKAFYNTVIEEIELPMLLKELGNLAFSNCLYLKDIYVRSRLLRLIAILNAVRDNNETQIINIHMLKCRKETVMKEFQSLVDRDSKLQWYIDKANSEEIIHLENMKVYFDL